MLSTSAPEKDSMPAGWWPMRGVFFCYLAGLGAMGVYWPLWMHAQGISEGAIGLLFGCRTLIGVLAQPALTWLADHLGRPVMLLRAAVLGVLLTTAMLPLASGFGWIAAIIWLMAPFESVMLPLLDSIILRQLPARQFGRIRMWGSLGYGSFAGIFGWVSRNWTPMESGRASVWLFMGLYLIALPLVLMVPEVARAPEQDRDETLRLKFSNALSILLLMSALHFAAIMMFKVLLSLQALQLGFNNAITGGAVALAIGGEFLMLANSERVLGRTSNTRWLVVVFLVGVFRWLVVAWVPVPWIWMTVNVLHFFGFGAWYVVTMRILGTFAPERQRTTLQGVFAAAVLGGGGVLGMWLGGWLMNELGGSATFTGAAVLEVAALVMLAVLSRLRRLG